MDIDLAKLLAFLAVIFFVILCFLFFDRGHTKRSRRKRTLKDSEIVRVLLNLNEEKVDELLRLYKAEFGPGPARYAKRTREKWKSGEVSASGQTYNRFLVHLPSVMDFDMKCEALRHFMNEFRTRSNIELSVDLNNWETVLTPIVTDMITKSYNAEMPTAITEKLTWLCAGEMAMAHEIIKRSEIEETRIAVSMLRQEFERIDKMYGSVQGKAKISHTIRLPQGTIDLVINRSK